MWAFIKIDPDYLTKRDTNTCLGVRYKNSSLNFKGLIVNMFHSVPGVPCAKMERAAQ